MGVRMIDQPSTTSYLSEHKTTAELMSEFSKKATKFLYPKPHVLFNWGEPAKSVYLVRSGEVVLTMPISGKQAMSLHAGENSLVGLPATFSNEPYSMTATAQRNTEVERMDREQFRLMLVMKPALSLHILRILAEETRSARIGIVEAGAKRRHVLKRKA
ncbi:Crp/Fnr family transcriptional regulator [Acidobacteria bacterium AB60]|nr:Crp/Fnr family transcriptional regulator [Acidobacteria bacterium AB60]